MVRPLPFLGVGGVLNPVLASPDPAVHDILEHAGLLSQRHGRWLREPAHTCDLVRAATWEHGADLHIAPRLGLPPLPVVEFTDCRPRSGDPAPSGAERYAGRWWAQIPRNAAGRPFARTDDTVPRRLVRQAVFRTDRQPVAPRRRPGVPGGPGPRPREQRRTQVSAASPWCSGRLR